MSDLSSFSSHPLYEHNLLATMHDYSRPSFDVMLDRVRTDLYDLYHDDPELHLKYRRRHARTQFCIDARLPGNVTSDNWLTMPIINHHGQIIYTMVLFPLNIYTSRSSNPANENLDAWWAGVCNEMEEASVQFQHFAELIRTIYDWELLRVRIVPLSL